MEEILVPDVGSDDAVEVIEIMVKVGDSIQAEDTIVVLESEKATMEVPSPSSGVVTAVHVAENDKVFEGHLLLTIEAEGSSGGAVSSSGQADAKVAAKAEETLPDANEPEVNEAEINEAEAQAPAASGSEKTEAVLVPDIGGDAEVIEILVAVGDVLAAEDIIAVLESDKASMEVPSPVAGRVESIACAVGDKVGEGSALLSLAVTGTFEAGAEVPTAASAAPEKPAPKNTAVAEPAKSVSASAPAANSSKEIHAGPAVRKLARKMGINLSDVSGSGPKKRLLKDDLYAHVKSAIAKVNSGGSGLPELPDIDFSQFGDIEKVARSKIQKVSAINLHRSWVNLPHVTQFDEADITQLEAFRKEQAPAYKAQDVKLTLLAFLVKACAATLSAFPQFNSSLSADGEHLIKKKYCHIGIAVDTPNGLVVPVIRDVDKKSVIDIAKDMQVISVKARDRKLMPKDMKGGCFSISSLGGIGGTSFTPIVNWPEVAILGVSRSAIKPVYEGGEFVPRLMLPLSLSYDHRVVDGADAARFTVHLSKLLGDIRHLVL